MSHRSMTRDNTDSQRLILRVYPTIIHTVSSQLEKSFRDTSSIMGLLPFYNSPFTFIIYYFLIIAYSFFSSSFSWSWTLSLVSVVSFVSLDSSTINILKLLEVLCSFWYNNTCPKLTSCWDKTFALLVPLAIGVETCWVRLCWLSLAHHQFNLY